ncbi:MAG: DMT family transporter [Pseudomonadota bacterium]
MIAFAGNSLLARLALADASMDPALFTTLRLVSGALALLGFAYLSRRHLPVQESNWKAAVALFVYAAGFAFAYVQLSAATGALILFATVQLSLIAYGVYNGQRLVAIQAVGIAMGALGILILMLPGLASPDWLGSLLMVTAGLAWAVYTIQGGVRDPILASRNNFVGAALLCPLLLIWLPFFNGFSVPGIIYALLSGVFASAGGYIIWYAVLKQFNAIDAATVQLSVPIITALLGIVLLSEPLTLHVVIAFVVSIFGIGLSIRYAPKSQ